LLDDRDDESLRLKLLRDGDIWEEGSCCFYD